MEDGVYTPTGIYRILLPSQEAGVGNTKDALNRAVGSQVKVPELPFLRLFAQSQC